MVAVGRLSIEWMTKQEKFKWYGCCRETVDRMKDKTGEV